MCLPAASIARFACTSREVLRISVCCRSSSAPTIVTTARLSITTVRHRFADATAPTSHYGQRVEETRERKRVMQREVAAEPRGRGPGAEAQLCERRRDTGIGELIEPARIDGCGHVALVFRGDRREQQRLHTGIELS